MEQYSLSFVIPCYCSQDTVGAVVRELTAAVAAHAPGARYEIILVNDGSPDGTAGVIRALAESDPDHIAAVDLARNFGQHAALMAGLRQVRGDVAVCLDDDGQTPADEYYKLVEKLDEGYDLVYARYAHKQHSFFRNWGSRFNAWCDRVVLSKPKGLSTTSYFACRRFLVDSAVKYENPFPYIGGLMAQGTRRFANVDVHHRARAQGASGYTLRKLVRLWSNGLTAFSVIPLRIATYLGLATSAVGFVMALVVIIRKLLRPDVPMGWSSLMTVLLVMCGLIMLMLGVLGEYIGRIYMSLNALPQYVVRSVTDARAEMPRAGAAPAQEAHA